MEPIVTLDRLDASLGGARVLSGVTFTLARGAGVAVLGPNGSGKSTLLRLLRGELWPDPASPGRRLFHGADGAWESPIGVRERLARVAPEAQDAYLRNDWELPVEAVIRSGFFDQLWPSEAATPAQAARVRTVAEALGVTHLLQRSFLELSRGEGRRVLLARALAPRPDALLLDEACDGLDAEARAGLLERVSRILRGGTAVVMATHRADEIVPEIQRVVWLEDGRIVRVGTREEALREAPALEPEPAFRPPFPDPDLSPAPVAPDLGGRTSATAPASTAPTASGPRAPGPRRRAPLFTLRAVTVLVEGRPVLDGIDWTVRRGERWCVLGPNGAGKSTLLRLLAGEEQPARGAIDRLGLGLHAAAEELAGRVGLVSPELQARHRVDALAGDVVASGFQGSIGLAAPPSAAELEAARRAASRLGIAALLRRHVHSLSYGELRKVLLARALAPAPDVLLLDEPLAGLDRGARRDVLALLDVLRAEGTAVIAVSHHADELPREADGLLRLAQGRVFPCP
ncbi:ATP-binding cassette domain-containing protein [Anaeromyxobacter oryzisoli]|uniref:ATP-binding cassette domain-containing protein n=1 Tax=Anaeromyxobacter oryzisoli TaxID=2925408 RepID=UPI001F599A02|nr:ATP-binding cassette domain-containing protein [Anaeromyxobacter sp. SG63]